MSTTNKGSNQRSLGITVLGDFILSEGPEQVVQQVLRAGATAVACNPTVTAPAAVGTGSFQPPSDAGMSPRVFDRPLFGRPALWVESGPSYLPNADFYGDSPYPPRKTNKLTDEHGHVIGRFIAAALKNGLKVYFQLGAAQPSGLRDEDRPRLPNGELSAGRMADTGSLASEAVRAYNRAYVRDLLAAYPQISGFRIDWPEYPCYTFGEIFQDFSPHVETFARRHGFDFESIREEAARCYAFLQGELTNDLLREFAGDDDSRCSPPSLLDRFPGIAEWLRLKAALSTDLVRDWREAITESGGAEKELIAHAFMPPYSFVTGLDFARVAESCTSVSPKLYTMHWSLMVQFWGEALLKENPGLDERLIVKTLVNLMDLADAGQRGETISDYGYPEPDQPHPIPNEPQRRKIAQARAAMEGKSSLIPLVHGYGPLDDFRRRFQLVAEINADGVWINRYGYLSDAKLDTIAKVVGSLREPSSTRAARG